MRKTYHEIVKYKEEIETAHIQKYRGSNIRKSEWAKANQLKVLRTMIIMRKSGVILLDLKRAAQSQEHHTASLILQKIKGDTLVQLINLMLSH